MKKRKKLTDRKRLERDLEKLITEKLRAKFGNVCQITGKPDKQCGQFHILPKGAYPNLKYRPENILWAGWFSSHYAFHHDYYKARDEIVPRIKALLGDDYEERLKAFSATLPKTNMTVLEELHKWWSEYE